MLYIGEQVGRRDKVGRRNAAEIDIAVDPLEGTNLVAHGQANAITVLAASERDGLVHAPDTYMEKLCVGPVVAGKVDIRMSPTENLLRIASALGRSVSDITVVILERPRHDALIAEVREAGARIKLISDGDLSAAISCAVSGTGVHAVMGIGGAPEGVITAAALRCLGGEIQARFRFRNDEERQRAIRMGHGDEDKVYHTEDLASGEHLVFAATGVTSGDLLEGRPVLRRRRPHALARDGLPDEAGPLRRHGPHVRPEPPARRPAVARYRHVHVAGSQRPTGRTASGPSSSGLATSRGLDGLVPAGRHETGSEIGQGSQHEQAVRRLRVGHRERQVAFAGSAERPAAGRSTEIRARPNISKSRSISRGPQCSRSARPNARSSDLSATRSATAPVSGSGPDGTSRATTALRNSGWSVTPQGAVT